MAQKISVVNSKHLDKLKLKNRKLNKVIEDLWDSEWRFRQLFLFSPMAMIMFDKGKKVNFINNKFIELFGFDLDNPPTVARWLIVAFPDKKERLKIKNKWEKGVAKALRREKEIEPIKAQVICKDKEQRFVEMDFSAFGQTAVVTFTDLSEYKRIDDMKTEFVSLASHQLRTPLGGLRWTLEMLINGDMGKLPKQAHDAVRKVYESNQYLIRLVNDLLNISRIEQQKIFSQPRLVNIKNVIAEATNTVVNKSQPEFAKLIQVIWHDKIPQIRVDRNLLKEVTTNLLSNAVKYSYMGGKIKVEVKKQKTDVQISIVNKGIGIPKKDQEKIFSKLFRAGNALKKNTVGSGLGLYVVKSYVESWGGKVGFSSKENQGATFWFTIPLRYKKKVKK